MAGKRRASVDNPTDISVILERILGAAEIQPYLDDAQIFRRWPEIIGDAIAQKVKLVDFREGVMLLHTESAVWRSEVNFAKKAILERSNSLLGKVVAKDIRFV